MSKRLIIIVAVLSLAVVAVGAYAFGARNGTEAPAGTAASTPADTSRETCHRFSTVQEAAVDDPLQYRPVWETAKAAEDPGIAAAGTGFEALVAEYQQTGDGSPERFDAGLALFKQSTDMSAACLNAYGQGPW